MTASNYGPRLVITRKTVSSTDTSISVRNAGTQQNPELLTGENGQMVNGTTQLSNDQANELQSILAELRRTLTTMADENQKLIELAKYYGYEPWRSITLLDRGAKARQVYEQVMGRRFNERSSV